MWTKWVYRNSEPNSFMSLYLHKTYAEKLNAQVIYTEYICCVIILIVTFKKFCDHNSLSYAAV